MFDLEYDASSNSTPWMQYTQGNSLMASGSFISEINSRGSKIARETEYGHRVSCYRNLNQFAKQIFSVKQENGPLKGSVSDYARVIVLKGTKTDPLKVKISEA